MTRKAIPTRRHCVTASTTWRGQKIEVSVGIDPKTGKVAEAFADIAKGGQIQHEMSDALILASIAMQCGVPIEDLQKTLGTQTIMVDGKPITEPTSPVGATLDAVRFIADGIKTPGFFDEEAKG